MSTTLPHITHLTRATRFTWAIRPSIFIDHSIPSQKVWERRQPFASWNKNSTRQGGDFWAQNRYYVSLRTRASISGEAMARAMEQSQRAYRDGEGARAKELSREGWRHQAEMERLNREASEWVFRKNNEHSPPNEVDLHSLTVREVVDFATRAIQQAQARGDPELRLVVGKGIHSSGGVAKIKPAIEELMRQHDLVGALDPYNPGIVIVYLDSEMAKNQLVIGPDDMARRFD